MAKKKKQGDGRMLIRGQANFGPIQEVAAADGAKKKQRTVEIVLYTGVPLVNQGGLGWMYPVVIDLDGIDAGDGVIPILDEHGGNPWSDDGKTMKDYVVGQSKSVKVEDGKLIVRGVIFDTAPAQTITALADQGFAWQASIGARSLAKDFIGEGSSVEVNGQTFEGPLYVSRQTKVREGSLVVLGDDPDTSAIVAAGRVIMNFAQYVKAKSGKSLEELDDALRASLQAEFDAAIKGAGKMECDADDEDDEDEEEEDEDEEEDTKAKGAKAKGKSDIAGAQRQAVRNEILAETKRCNAVRQICARDPMLNTEIAGKQVNVLEHALMAGWSANKTERIVLREERKGIEARGNPNAGSPASPHFYMPSKAILNSAVVEAALMQAGGGSMNPLEIDLDAWKNPHQPGDYVTAKRIVADNRLRYSDQVQQAAHDHFGRNGISLHDMLRITAAAGNYHLSPINRINDSNLYELLEAAFSVRARRGGSRSEEGNIRADGGSTVSLTSVLANLLNKYLGFGYLFTDASWRKITSTAPAKDFKPTLAISLTGDFVFKKLGSDGQIPNAALTDEAYSNQIATFARKLSLARQTLIDDDTNALTVVPKLIGIGALDAISITLWSLWLQPGLWASGAPNRGDGNNFWSAHAVAMSAMGGGACNTNYQSGGASALSASSLQTAWQQQTKQVKPNGQPLGVKPTILLYPPELDGTARGLMNSDFVVASQSNGAAATLPDKNVWQGRFDLVESPYLSNSNYNGNSATAWWILANPGVLAAVEARFLNGQETPSVLNVNLNNQGNELGISIVGFLDFGCAMQNPRAGQMSAGA